MISAFVSHDINSLQCLFTLSASWLMAVLQDVVTQVFYAMSNKLTLKAAEGHVAPRVSLHLTLCEEWHSAGLQGAGEKSETMCGCEVGLIFLTLCADELTVWLSAVEWAFRVTSTVDAFKVPSEDTWLGKGLTALRTPVARQLCFIRGYGQRIWTKVGGKYAAVWETLSTFFTLMRFHCLHCVWNNRGTSYRLNTHW